MAQKTGRGHKVGPHHTPQRPSYDGSGDLDPGIVEILNNRGIEKLWSHQSNAYRLASSGRDIVVVTPTASGKTFCYDIPVVDSILRDPTGRALYLFPTKALAQDQLAELEELCSGLSVDIKSFTYDRDTPASKEKRDNKQREHSNNKPPIC